MHVSSSDLVLMLILRGASARAFCRRSEEKTQALVHHVASDQSLRHVSI